MNTSHLLGTINSGSALLCPNCQQRLYIGWIGARAYRDVSLWHDSAMRWRAEHVPGISDINLLGYGECIVYLDADSEPCFRFWCVPRAIGPRVSCRCGDR
jgi:hypothetical protein